MSYRGSGSRWEASLRPEDLDHGLDFGLQIRYARQAKGLSGYYLSELLDVSPQAYFGYEHGLPPAKRIADRIIPLLGQFLGLDEDCLRWTWEQAQVSRASWGPTPQRRERQRERREQAMAQTEARRVQVEELWAARQRERQGWADDYRRLLHPLDGGHIKRLAAGWKVSRKGASSRVWGLFAYGFLASEERFVQREVCKKGLHPLTGDNVIGPQRACRTCRLANDRAYARSLRGRVLEKGDERHGTRTGAVGYRCPCSRCALWRRQERVRRRQVHPRPHHRLRRSRVRARRTTAWSMDGPVTAFGETRTARGWALDPRCPDVSPSTIIGRLRAGWTPEEAVTTRSRQRRGSSYRKLTDYTVTKIRRQAAEGAVLDDLARQYAVSLAYISSIVANKARHDPDYIPPPSRAPGPKSSPIPSEKVAEIYNTAVRFGEFPVKAVAEALGMSRKSAEKRVQRARRKGLLILSGAEAATGLRSS